MTLFSDTPYPHVFAYVGETKGLRENGLHQGETKELANAKAKEKQREAERWSWREAEEGFAAERGRTGSEYSQRIILRYLPYVKQYLVGTSFETGTRGPSRGPLPSKIGASRVKGKKEKPKTRPQTTRTGHPEFTSHLSAGPPA